MNKKTLSALLAVVVLTVGSAVAFAGPNEKDWQPGPRHHQAMAPLNDQQTAEMAALHNQMLAIKKQMLQKEVEYGRLTQEQADKRIEWMQKHLETMKTNHFACPAPNGERPHRPHGPHGQPPMEPGQQ